MACRASHTECMSCPFRCKHVGATRTFGYALASVARTAAANLDLPPPAELPSLDQTRHPLRQVVAFHPEHYFAGEDPEDPSSFTNRAPHPAIHILRSQAGVAGGCVAVWRCSYSRRQDSVMAIPS